MAPRSERFSHEGRDGVGLHALHWGDESRPTLVLLHGGGANAHWWDHLAPSLAASRHVVALDFRGHGDSDHPEELRTGAFNDDLETLCEHLGSHEVVLIGHSMGAHVALDHASRHPETRGLVLIDPARGGAKRARRVARLALALRRTYRSAEEAVRRYRFVPAAEHVSEELRQSIARRSVRREGEGQYGFKFDPRWFTVPARPPPSPLAVGCPVLVIRGAESAILGREAAGELVDALPNARLVEIPQAGHHVQLDQPEAVQQALSAFVGEVS